MLVLVASPICVLEAKTENTGLASAVSLALAAVVAHRVLASFLAERNSVETNLLHLV